MIACKSKSSVHKRLLLLVIDDRSFLTDCLWLQRDHNYGLHVAVVALHDQDGIHVRRDGLDTVGAARQGCEGRDRED